MRSRAKRARAGSRKRRVKPNVKRKRQPNAGKVKRKPIEPITEPAADSLHAALMEEPMIEEVTEVLEDGE